MANLLIHTSVEDMASSLKLYNPKNKSEATKMINNFWDNVLAEKDGKNRTSVIKLFENKIKQIQKIYHQR